MNQENKTLWQIIREGFTFPVSKEWFIEHMQAVGEVGLFMTFGFALVQISLKPQEFKDGAAVILEFFNSIVGY